MAENVDSPTPTVSWQNAFFGIAVLALCCATQEGGRVCGTPSRLRAGFAISPCFCLCDSLDIILQLICRLCDGVPFPRAVTTIAKKREMPVKDRSDHLKQILSFIVFDFVTPIAALLQYVKLLGFRGLPWIQVLATFFIVNFTILQVIRWTVRFCAISDAETVVPENDILLELHDLLFSQKPPPAPAHGTSELNAVEEVHEITNTDRVNDHNATDEVQDISVAEGVVDVDASHRLHNVNDTECHELDAVEEVPGLNGTDRADAINAPSTEGNLNVALVLDIASFFVGACMQLALWNSTTTYFTTLRPTSECWDSTDTDCSDSIVFELYSMPIMSLFILPPGLLVILLISIAFLLDMIVNLSFIWVPAISIWLAFDRYDGFQRIFREVARKLFFTPSQTGIIFVGTLALLLEYFFASMHSVYLLSALTESGIWEICVPFVNLSARFTIHVKAILITLPITVAGWISIRAFASVMMLTLLGEQEPNQQAIALTVLVGNIFSAILYFTAAYSSGGTYKPAWTENLGRM